MKGWHGWMKRDRAGTVLKNRTVLRPFPSVGQICARVNTELSIVHNLCAVPQQYEALTEIYISFVCNHLYFSLLYSRGGLCDS